MLVFCPFVPGPDNPQAGYQFLCDSERDCINTTFATEDEFQACMAAARDAITVCGEACIDPPDLSGCTDAHTTCYDSCESSYDDCSTACQSTFDTCVEACDPPGPGTDCYTECLTDKETCDGHCSDARLSCHWPCKYGLDICTATAETPTDPGCTANCCVSDHTRKPYCDSICQGAYNDAVYAANVAKATCESGCTPISWNSPPDESTIQIGACGTDCLNTYEIDIQTATVAQQKCNRDCADKYNEKWGRCNTNFWCYKKCLDDSLDAQLLCFIEGIGGSDTQMCYADAADISYRCNAECCFQFYGRNVFHIAAIECKSTQGFCYANASISNPPPGTGPGDPCEHPGPECDAAITAWEATLAAAQDACKTDYIACIHAIRPYNDSPCTGACSGVTLPLPEESSSSSSSA